MKKFFSSLGAFFKNVGHFIAKCAKAVYKVVLAAAKGIKWYCLNLWKETLYGFFALCAVFGIVGCWIVEWFAKIGLTMIFSLFIFTMVLVIIDSIKNKDKEPKQKDLYKLEAVEKDKEEVKKEVAESFVSSISGLNNQNETLFTAHTETTMEQPIEPDVIMSYEIVEETVEEKVEELREEKIHNTDSLLTEDD